ETIETNLSAVWEAGHQEAWFLISDQPAGWRQVRTYALRMRVEATFQDTKSRGWNLEASWIADPARLDRLLLALFLAIWWVSHLAACCIHQGHRDRGCLVMIEATRASFALAVSGCWISCIGPPIRRPSNG